MVLVGIPYVLARAYLFLSTPVITYADTWAFVAPEDGYREIIESKSRRPGFLYQIVLRILPVSNETFIVNDGQVAVLQTPTVPLVAVLAVVLSTGAWLFISMVLGKLLGGNGVSSLITQLAVLAFSLTPGVWIWDHIVQAESMSLSFTVLWLGSALKVLDSREASAIWLFASLVFTFISFGMRPSNAPVLIGATLVMMVLLFPRVMRSRLYALAWVTCLWFVINLAKRVYEISDRWSSFYGPAYEANRATSYLVLPSYLARIELGSEQKVCRSAMEFAQSRWAEGDYGSWGGVTEASRAENLESGCLGSWDLLGQSAPSLTATLFSWEIQQEWWQYVFPRAMDSVPDPVFLQALDISPLTLGASNALNSLPFSIGLVAALLGVIVALLSPRELRVAPALFSAAVAAGSLVGVWVLASLDGGAFDRHAVPYSLLLPVTTLAFGYYLTQLVRHSPVRPRRLLLDRVPMSAPNKDV